MLGPKIQGTISRTKTVRNFAKTAESLAKTSAPVPRVALVQSENTEKIVQLPSYLGSTRRLGPTQRPQEHVPALLVIDTTLNEDLADSESSSQEVHEGPVFSASKAISRSLVSAASASPLLARTSSSSIWTPGRSSQSLLTSRAC